MLSKDQGGEGWQSFLVHNHEPFQALLSPKQQIIAAICVSIIIVILIWCRMLDFLSERVFFEVDSAQDEQWRRLQRPPWAFGVGDIAIRGILANRDADYFRKFFSYFHLIDVNRIGDSMAVYDVFRKRGWETVSQRE